MDRKRIFRFVEPVPQNCDLLVLFLSSWVGSVIGEHTIDMADDRKQVTISIDEVSDLILEISELPDFMAEFVQSID